MAGNLKWNGAQCRAAVLAHFGRNLDAALIALQNHAKTLISVDGTGKRTVTRTDKRGRKRKGTVLVYNANPSKPGEPPRKQTGFLLGKVAHERQGMVGRVGTNVPYGRALELGTENMAPRPWLRRALVEMRAAIRAILSHPMP